MTQKHLATWPESPKRVRKKNLPHAKHTPRSHTKRLSSPSRDLASLGISEKGRGWLMPGATHFSLASS